MVEIFFCRHGQSKHNEKKLIQGQIDSELTDKGREQAKNLSETLSDENFDLIYSSDLKRARETAEIIQENHDKELMETEKLRERNLGELEGKHYTEWDQVNAEDHHSWSPKNGESLKEHKKRVCGVLDQIRQENPKKVLIVSHGGSIKAAITAVLKCDSRQSWRLNIENCSITRLKSKDEGWIIEEVNNTAHLKN